MAYFNSTSGAPAPIGSGIAAAFKSLSERWARYRVYSQTLTELGALSDRELADLGLNRSMIRACAYKAAYDG